MVVVPFDQSRRGKPFRFLNGTFYRLVSASETGGALCIFDTVRDEPGGPALHLHFDQDEWFYVTDGQFDVRVGDETFHLGPGQSVLGPRGIPHAFANTTPRGSIIVAFTPAGSMEQFFEEGSSRSPMAPEDVAELSARHGMKVVGPPLGARR